MNTVTDITVIVLTGNEAGHIRRCIDNVRAWVRDVFIVDSFSGDQTIEIAQSRDARVFQNTWEGLYARQFNWALDNLPIRTEWVLRLDADEYLCPDLIQEIQAKLAGLPAEVTGVEFKRRHIFLGKWIKNGTYPVKLLRLFRYGKARCEQRLMDEHMALLEGRSIEFDGDFSDHNLGDLSWWTQKHVGYAIREAADLLDIEYGLFNSEAGKGFNAEAQGRRGEEPVLGEQASAKRRMKLKYAKAPLFWRAFAYFCMRYFVRGGFLEGKEGFMWHFFQGLWYRMLVDAKIWEIKRESGGDRNKILALLRGKYGLKI